MAFGDPYTIDDLERAETLREGVTLTPQQLEDLLEEIENADENADERASVDLAVRIAPVFRAMPLKWRKALAEALDMDVDDVVWAAA